MLRAIALYIPHRKAALVKRIALGMLPLGLLLAVLPSWAATTKVTVEQLEQSVSAWHDLADKEMAAKLGVLELSERLSKPRFDRLNAALPGDKSRLALLALADSSAFLRLPQADQLKMPPPDMATQGRIVSQAADFVVATVASMPSFLASQTTTRFQDIKVIGGMDEPVVVTSAGFHFVDRVSANVSYKRGREVIEAPSGNKPAGSRNAGKDHESASLLPGAAAASGLNNWGIFGPLLGVVMGDILKGKIGWGHWEQGEHGPLAVFRFFVPEDRATYTVRYCCFQNDRGDLREFETVPAYHGEIAIDPKTGAVLRLVLKMDLEPQLVIKRVDQTVDYGLVEVGGKSYVCPLHSTSITRTQTTVSNEDGVFGRKTDPLIHADGLSTPATVSQPLVTAINDITFDSYHQFRVEMRVLPADGTDRNGSNSTDAPASATKPPA